MGAERRTFEVDGVTYDSIDDVPEPQRCELERLLVDDDGDGVPDVVQSGTERVTMSVERVHIEVDGVTYDSIDDVPEPHRSAVQRALRQSSPRSSPTSSSPSVRGSRAPNSVPDSAAQPGTSPIVSRAGSSRTKLLAAFVVLDAMAVGVIAWLLLR